MYICGHVFEASCAYVDVCLRPHVHMWTCVWGLMCICGHVDETGPMSINVHVKVLYLRSREGIRTSAPNFTTFGPMLQSKSNHVGVHAIILVWMQSYWCVHVGQTAIGKVPTWYVIVHWISVHVCTYSRMCTCVRMYMCGELESTTYNAPRLSPGHLQRQQLYIQ